MSTVCSPQTSSRPRSAQVEPRERSPGLSHPLPRGRSVVVDTRGIRGASAVTTPSTAVEERTRARPRPRTDGRTVVPARTSASFAVECVVRERSSHGCSGRLLTGANVQSSHKIHDAVRCYRRGVVVIVTEDVFRPTMINPRRPGQATRRCVSYELPRLIVHVDTRQ